MAYLIPTTYFHVITDLQDACKLHEPTVVKVAADSQVVAVTGKVVHLINVDATTLIGHDLLP